MPGKSKRSPTIIESTKSDSDKVKNKTTNLGGKSDELLATINGQEKITKLREELEQNFGIEIDDSDIDFKYLDKLEWNKELEDKLNLLKGKPYAPEDISDVSMLNKLDINEINRRIELAAKLEQDFGIKTKYFFADFGNLGEIKWNNEIKNKLNLLKGKTYAPGNIITVSTLNKLNINEINRRIELAIKLEQDFGIEIDDSGIDFAHLGKLEWNKELEHKLNILKGKPYAPKSMIEVSMLNEWDINKINRKIAITDVEKNEFHDLLRI